MIKQIQINNFQSHKETLLELSSGINAISGISDSGKSAIIRALNWTINNKPNGDHFRRHKTNTTTVEIKTETSQIKRIKGKGKNEYRLDEKVYKAFGQEVPDNICESLNIENINIQKQADSIFLLNKSAGEIARILNQTVNFDSIDIAQANISRTLRKENEKLEHEKERSREVKEEIKRYEWIKEAEIKAQRLEKIGRDIKEKKEKVEKLREAVYEIEKIDRELKKYKGIKGAISEVDNLIERSFDINKRQKKLSELKNILYKRKEEQKNLEAILTLSCSSRKRFKKLMPATCPLCGRGN